LDKAKFFVGDNTAVPQFIRIISLVDFVIRTCWSRGYDCGVDSYGLYDKMTVLAEELENSGVAAKHWSL
jgi:hypothetical protein